MENFKCYCWKSWFSTVDSIEIRFELKIYPKTFWPYFFVPANTEILYFDNLEKGSHKGGHGRSYLTLNTSKIMERLGVLTRDFSSLQQPFKVKYELPCPPFGPLFQIIKIQHLSVNSLEQKSKVKTFLDKLLVQIEFQCCLLLKIAIFNSRIWNFPKSGFTYRFQIKLDFFLKRIRH